MRHVIKLPKNRLGRDFIIGDVHGAARAFAEVLKKLGPNDRLFIVGDLIDRGEDSAAIIELIQRQNAGKIPPQIYITKGNHEALFLEALDFLSAENPEYVWDPRNRNGHPLLNFLGNGGEWIYESAEVRRRTVEFVRNPGGIGFQTFLNYLKDKTLRSDLRELGAFIQELPYAIQTGELGDPRSFVVCHSDMPLGDAQLAAIANGTGELSEKHQYHMLWARPDASASGEPVILRASPDVRMATSMVDYSGHNAMYSEKTRIDRHIKIINGETNTVNLDFGAFRNGFVVVNHTDQAVEVVTAPREVASDFLVNAAREITCYLKAQFSKRLVLADRAALDEADKPLFDELKSAAQSEAKELAETPSLPTSSTVALLKSGPDEALADLIDNHLATRGNETAFVGAIKEALAQCESKQKASVDRAIFHSAQTARIAQLINQLNASAPGSAEELQSAKAVATVVLREGMIRHKVEKSFGIVVRNFEIACLMQVFQEKGWVPAEPIIEKDKIIRFERIGITPQPEALAVSKETSAFTAALP